MRLNALLRDSLSSDHDGRLIACECVTLYPDLLQARKRRGGYSAALTDTGFGTGDALATCGQQAENPSAITTGASRPQRAESWSRIV